MQLSDELIEKIWQIISERQQSINRQMDEGEKKYFQRMEESKRILEESEKKFFDRLEEKKKHLDETESEFYQRLEANRILFENARYKEEQETGKRSKKKLLHNIEISDHPVYSAIIKLFTERGYKIDEETLKLYWELVTSITRAASPEHFSEH